MSLINKMLQDLDARGGNGARGDASSLVRPVSRAARGGPSPVIVGAGLLAMVVLGVAGFAGWKYWHRGQASISPPVAASAAQAVPASAAVKPAAEPMQTSVAAPAPAKTAEAGPISAPAPMQRADRVDETASAAAGDKLRPAAPRAAGKRTGGSVVMDAPHGKATAAREAAAKQLQPAVPVAEGGEAGFSSQQKAENEYRRALLKLQDARISEAIAGLEQAIFLYPRHEAARQTLIGLLVEGGRTADAMRHLALGLDLDPRQVNMAMLLARLQLENGGNALATLQNSLPYAEADGDYRALMAGVLQRANRHKEAVEQYMAAVRRQPANGVWWMGLGISLQAEKRSAEAKTAFQRAKDSGRLTPELQSFVERRLQQLD